MKQILTALVLCFSLMTFAQEDLTLSADLTLNSGQEQTYNTLDLNGFDVVLGNNSSLTVVNLIGPGNVSTQSNANPNSPSAAILIVTGFIDCGNLTFEGNQSFSTSSNFTSCDTLNTNEFTLNVRELPMGEKYQVILYTGQVIMDGVIDEQTFNKLPRKEFFIMKVEGYNAKKEYLTR